MNSAVGPIFNEKVAEKWYLWDCEQCCGTHWCDKNDKKVEKVRLLFMNSSRCPLLQLTKKKKKKKEEEEKMQHKTQTWDSLLSKQPHSIVNSYCVKLKYYEIHTHIYKRNNKSSPIICYIFPIFERLAEKLICSICETPPLINTANRTRWSIALLHA